jgi:hypothetical protein
MAKLKTYKITDARAKAARHPKAAAKASAAKKNLQPRRLAMHKRNLRVVKWIGTVPAIGVCTYCAMNFNVPVEKLKRTSDAQESLRKQFEEHKCQRGDASEASST